MSDMLKMCDPPTVYRPKEPKKCLCRTCRLVRRIAKLEAFRTHVKDAVSQCQDKGFDVVPITVLEYLLEKVAK